MAPELLLPDESSNGLPAKPSLDSDTWAFGMLMLEIFTDEIPYSKEINTKVLWLITQEHKVPERPDEHITERGLTDTVWELMTECWNFKYPEKRPKAEYLMRRLHTLYRDIEITAWKERTVRGVLFYCNPSKITKFEENHVYPDYIG
jgi:serine/threonine protein kinase